MMATAVARLPFRTPEPWVAVVMRSDREHARR
jgi:hypothetical protein